MLNTFIKTGEVFNSFLKVAKISLFCIGKKISNDIIIGPIEHNPVTPNESPLLFLPPRTLATPAPKVNKKGTVIGPVVTPLLSKLISHIALPLLPNRQASPKIKA